MSIKKHSLFIFILSLTILCDISSKLWAKSYILEPINILWNIVFFEHIQNPGIAFSLPLTGIVLKIVTIVLILGLFGYYLSQEAEKKNKYIHIAFWLILGWAIGNGIERIYYGSVTDFIGVTGFAVMNIADIAISIGATIYVWISFLQKNNSSS